MRIELTLTKEQNELLIAVKNLISHVQPNASTAEAFEYLAKDFLKRKDPKQKLNTKNLAQSKVNILLKAAVTAAHQVTKNVGKHNFVSASEMKYANNLRRRKSLPQSTKRTVWLRDQGKCQHFNHTTQSICGSQHLLEYDHIIRHRHGGDDRPQNLRLLCKAHNLWRG